MSHPGFLGKEPVGSPDPAGAPGWFGGAINRTVDEMAAVVGDLDGLWVEVWISSAGWVLREVRPAGPVPPPWVKPAVSP